MARYVASHRSHSFAAGEESLSKLLYFHPHLLTMDQIRAKLMPFIRKNGHFLVRISMNQEKTYTVSVVHDHSIKHFRILTSQGQYYLLDKHFATIDDLVKHYGSTDVPNQEGIRGVRLLFPILNPSAEPLPSTQRRPSLQPERKRSVDEESLHYDRVFSRRDSTSSRALPSPPPSSGREVPNRRLGSSSDVFRPRSDNLNERPPMPLPSQDSERTGIYNGLYYSCIKAEQQNRLPELIEALSMSQGDGEEMTTCECGLDLEMSQLPHGWSVHISREQNTAYGRPFFMSPSQLTSWDLPRDIYLELNQNQQKFIKILCDNFKAGRLAPEDVSQLQFSYSPSSSSSSPVRTRSMSQSSSMSSFDGAAAAADRDSTGSNTGAAGFRGSSGGGSDMLANSVGAVPVSRASLQDASGATQG